MKIGIIPVFFLIDVFYSCWNLIKLGLKFYDNYKMTKYIHSMTDFDLTGEEDRVEICNICLDEIKLGKKLNCGHMFHLRCIKYII